VTTRSTVRSGGAVNLDVTLTATAAPARKNNGAGTRAKALIRFDRTATIPASDTASSSSANVMVSGIVILG
jgi:hypothetical protein